MTIILANVTTMRKDFCGFQSDFMFQSSSLPFPHHLWKIMQTFVYHKIVSQFLLFRSKRSKTERVPGISATTWLNK